MSKGCHDFFLKNERGGGGREAVVEVSLRALSSRPSSSLVFEYSHVKISSSHGGLRLDTG